MSNKILWIVVALVVIVGAGSIVLSHHNKAANPPKRISSLSSLNSGPAPWPAEHTHLQDRMNAIGLSLLSAEGTAQHIHAHLDVYIHGKATTVPADIGIVDFGISPVHTHDTTGVIHIESPDANAKYTLGQFFDLWGVKLTNNSIGKYATDGTNTMTVYDNGTPVSNPTSLVLAKHHEIAVEYGTVAEQPKIPTSYKFPDGL